MSWQYRIVDIETPQIYFWLAVGALCLVLLLAFEKLSD